MCVSLITNQAKTYCRDALFQLPFRRQEVFTPFSRWKRIAKAAALRAYIPKFAISAEDITSPIVTSLSYKAASYLDGLCPEHIRNFRMKEHTNTTEKD